MGAYLWEICRSLVRHRMGWWVGLAFAWLFSAGIWSDYPRIREQFNGWQGVVTLPQDISFWWFIVVPLALWLILAFAHNEALVELRSARLVFSEPWAERQVPLYSNGRLHEHLELVKINVANVPKDMARGRDVSGAFCEAHFFDRISGRLIKKIDYCRWTQNEKPGYPPNPHRFVNSWNYRDLQANGDNNTIDFAVKGYTDTSFWGFAGRSQTSPLWRDPSLKISEMDLLVRIVVKGKGLRAPAETWVALQLTAGRSFQVERTRKRPPRYLHGV